MSTSAPELERGIIAAAGAHSLHPVVGLPPVLDVCCGAKMFWFDRKDSRAIYLDRRRAYRVNDVGTPGTIGRKPTVVEPDKIADFRNLPYPDNSFYHVVFDPPHMETLGATGKYAACYGRLEGDWREELRGGFAECFRVLKPHGTLIFKWCEVEISIREVLALTPEKPLYGHRSGKKSLTHWVAFVKPNTSVTGVTTAGRNVP